MKCKNIEPLLIDYLDGETAPQERSQVEAHLAGCAMCAAALAELRVVQQRTRTTLQAVAAVATPPASAWFRLQQALAPQPRPAWRQQVWGRLAWTALAGTMVLLMISTLLFTAPAVRAAVNDALHRFGLVHIQLVSLDPFNVYVTAEEVDETTVDLQLPQILSLAEAQQQVPFAIPTPRHLPDRLALHGVLVNHLPPEEDLEKSVMVVLNYGLAEETVESSTAGIIINVTSGPLRMFSAIDSAYAEPVQVHGQEAVFVRGRWHDLAFEYQAENEPAPSSSLQWDESADAGMLAWQRDGLAYTLSFHNLKLSPEEVIRIAESIS